MECSSELLGAPVCKAISASDASIAVC